MAVERQAIIDTPPASAVRSGGEIMCDALIAEGVRVVFGYPGGAIMPFYDAVYGCEALRHVLVRHEQGATHAADGYARITGQVGVCVGTSGPGATNMVTGLANAFMDSVPIVAITGQVARPAMGKDSFQETDVLGVTMSVTKHNILVESVEELGPAIHEAFAVARSGRPGPVLIDVPKDVQFERTAYAPLPHMLRRRRADLAAIHDSLRLAGQLLDGAKRPLIIAGHGVIIAGACEELRGLAERAGIPVSTTLLGISCFPESHRLAVGMPGMHGRAAVNRAIAAADVILAVGMRFDDRITGNVDCFAPHARIIHIDADAAELGKVITPDVPIHGDAREMLACLADLVRPNDHGEWVSRIGRDEPATVTAADGSAHPADIFAAIKEASRGRATIVSDVGQHQMWAARLYGYDLPNSHITSGGLGTMGFALPAAMGVKLGDPERAVWAVAGDGGIQMNIQEFATIADHDLKINVVVVNNGYLGMVRQWQKFFHGGRYSSTPISSPDYRLIAAAYGFEGRRVERLEDLRNAMDWAAASPRCVVVEVLIDGERNVYPMIPSGLSVDEMIEEPSIPGCGDA